MVVGEIYRRGDSWKFNAIGQPGYDPGIADLVNRYC